METRQTSSSSPPTTAGMLKTWSRLANTVMHGNVTGTVQAMMPVQYAHQENN